MTKFITFLFTILIFSSVVYCQTISLGEVTTGGVAPAAIKVPLTVSAPITNVKSITFQFTYNSNFVKFEHEAKDAHSGASNFALTNSENLLISDTVGLISLSWFSASGVTLNGKILDLNFTYKSGFSEIKIVSATIKDMAGKKYVVTLANGSISANTTPAIMMLYPNGGETLEVIGSPTNITWTRIYISKLKLEYTTDNGTNWNLIADSIDAKKDFYIWTIPDTINSTQCKVRVTDVEPAATSDMSDASFTINSTRVLVIKTPNGGEELQAGGVKNISWSFKNVINSKLEYTTNASAPSPTWLPIAASISSKDEVYEWVIPNTVSTDCKMRISDVTNTATVFDLSDVQFKIFNGPIKVQIDSVVDAHVKIIGKVIPMGGFLDRYWWWDEKDNSWSHENAKVTKDGKDYYAKDTLTVYGKVPVSAGWLTALQYLEMNISFDSNILVLDSLIIANSNLKKLNYSVKGNNIQVVWATGESIDIHGKLFDLKFNYKNFNKPLQWIDSGWDYDDSPVLNPNTPTAVIDPRNMSEIKIVSLKFKNLQGDTINASEWKHGLLTISDNPVVKLLSPVGGEVLEVNDGTAKILWSSRKVTNVKIQYSTDSGSSWSTDVVSSTNARTGSYTWTLPDHNYTTCKIQIIDVDNGSVNDKSASVFTITNVKSINLTSPDGGEIFKSGSLTNISWLTRNMSDIKIEYTADSDTTWTEIASSTRAKNYKYEWTVPNISSVKCRIRISEVIDAAKKDTSNALFTINNSKIRVKVPATVAPLGNIDVPIVTEQLNSMTYINIAIKYNPAVIEFDAVIPAPALNAGQFNKTISGGVIRLVWFSTVPVNVSGSLFTIKFKNYTGFSLITFSSPNQIKDSFGKLMDVEFVNGYVGTTDVEDEKIPSNFTLQQNYPNPFNPSTTIRYEIPKESHVAITIYNSIGQKIETLIDENKSAGYYQLQWNALNYANGVYFYSIITPGFVQTKKMILLK